MCLFIMCLQLMQMEILVTLKVFHHQHNPHNPRKPTGKENTSETLQRTANFKVTENYFYLIIFQ